MDLTNYTIHTLRLSNNETGEPGLQKYCLIINKTKNNFILNNSLGDEKLNKITVTIKEIYPPIILQSDDGT